VAPLRRSRSVPVRSPRRKTSWQIGPETGTNGSAQSITATGSTGASVGAQSAVDGNTLVRTRGELLLTLLAAAAAGDGFIGAFGIGVVTAQAFGIGITALPTPIDEEDWDGWLYHRYFSVVSSSIISDTVSSADDFANAVSAVLRVEIDSKAMRKVPENMTVAAVLQVTEVGTATMTWNFNSRMLIKLP